MNTQQKIYIILKILIIFLSSFLILSILNGQVNTFMAIGALSITYLTLHYWQKRVVRLKAKVQQVK